MEDLLLRKGKCRCICHKPTGVKGVFFDMCTSCKCNPLTTPPVNESLDEKFRALCDEYGCRDRAVEIAKELLSTARQEAKAERTEEIQKIISEANGPYRSADEVVSEVLDNIDSLTKLQEMR